MKMLHCTTSQDTAIHVVLSAICFCGFYTPLCSALYKIVRFDVRASAIRCWLHMSTDKSKILATAIASSYSWWMVVMVHPKFFGA